MDCYWCSPEVIWCKSLNATMQGMQWDEAQEHGSSRTSSGWTLLKAGFFVHAGKDRYFSPCHMRTKFMRTLASGQCIAHSSVVFAIGIGLPARKVNPAAFCCGHDRHLFIKQMFIGENNLAKSTNHIEQPDAKRPDDGKVWEHTEVMNPRHEVVLTCEHIYRLQHQL